MNDFYSNEADKDFTIKIANYNTLSSKEKSARRKEIVERTKILLYEIPIKYLFATEDQAINVFLEMHDEIDNIIANFRLCGVTFNNYLIQICRYRLLSEFKKERQREFEEASFLAEEEHLYQIREEEPLIEDEKQELHHGLNRPEVQNMNLKDLFEYIVRNKDEICTYKAECEEELNKLLSIKTNRKRFLILLLYLPETETKELINGFSKVLDLDYKVLARFFILKNTELDAHYITRDKALKTAARHWNTIQKLKRALYNETDEDIISSIQDKLSKVCKCHIKRCEIANAALSGMTQPQISEILGIPRSTVAQSIMQIRKELTEIADDIITEY